MPVSRRSVGSVLVMLAVLLSLPSQAAAISWGPIRAITSDEQGSAWAGSTVAYSGGVAIAYRHIVAANTGRTFEGQRMAAQRGPARRS